MHRKISRNTHNYVKKIQALRLDHMRGWGAKLRRNLFNKNFVSHRKLAGEGGGSHWSSDQPIRNKYRLETRIVVVEAHFMKLKVSPK